MEMTHVGRFLVSDRIVHSDERNKLNIFDSIFVFQSMYSMEQQGWYYTAESVKHFAPVPQGTTAPAYELKIVDGKVTFRRIEDDRISLEHKAKLLANDLNMIDGIACGLCVVPVGYLGATFESDKALKSVIILRQEFEKATRR